MSVQNQIDDYVAGLSESRRRDVQKLCGIVRELMPRCKLWFLDGKDAKGRTISNPSIGFGTQTMTYADGKTKEFYQVGISANTTGISVYLMGLEDRKYLPATYGKRLCPATVTGYCIKFRALEKIDVEALIDAMRDAIQQTRS